MDPSEEEEKCEAKIEEGRLDAPLPPVINGYHHPARAVSQEMCCFCFDVLVAHLTHSPPPRNAHFPNDE